MRYLNALTGLRFIAAALVFLHHLKFFFRTNTPLQGWLTKYLFHEGFIGVGFFFILSGFILAHRYQDEGLRRDGLRPYFAARIARIYPLHLLTLAVMILVRVGPQTVFDNRFAGLVLSHLSLTQSFVPHYSFYFAFNSVAWSLSDELFFYALFPVVLMLRPRSFNMLLGASALLVVSLALYWKTRLAPWFFYAFPPVRFVDFMIGIGLYRLYRRCDHVPVAGFWRGLGIELLAALSFALLFYFHPRIPAHIRYNFYYWVPLVLLIWSQVRAKGPLAQLMGTRVMVYLGNVSFAFYMVHAMLLELFAKQLLPYLRLPWWPTMGLAFLLTTLCAMAVHHFVEDPANRWLRRKLR